MKMRSGGVIVREKPRLHRAQGFEKGKNKRSARSDGYEGACRQSPPEPKQSGSQRMGVLNSILHMHTH